ncbi:MAG TPA: phosphatase PAP2 family protein, partial [Tepidisphaeraceae bacterium]|nr:phosphatase PAP2 family protein [Tepidisphaeraceae bacterium]
SGMSNPLRRIVERLGANVIIVLIACLIVVGGTWLFVELLDEVREGQTQHIDEWILRGTVPWREYAWLRELGRDITALGGNFVLTLLSAAVVLYLIMARKYHAMWLVIIATSGGLALSSLLKYLIDRQRPQLTEHLSHVYTSSFPSGHSMLAAVVYLTLGSLLASIVPGRALKIYVIGLALLVTFLVGLSRVYLGVHWPTDVLAGWTAGLVWAILCWVVARQLKRRGAIEAGRDEDADPHGATDKAGC